MSQKLTINLIEKFAPFLEPYRYKVAHGGRGSGKSWSIAQLLILLGYRKPLRVLCAREIQKSIQDSVLQLLDDQIEFLGLSDHYDVQRNAIYGKNGTKFIFEGLRSNITKIKSMEGIDVVWIEEAEAVTGTSWDTLIPTIRKNGSEIWISFNPQDEMDETYQRFVENPAEDSYVVQVNYMDNPYFPEVLQKEMEHMKAANHDLYLHVWEGQPLRNRHGAYFAKYIKEERVVSIPIETELPVSTYWDLGISDSMVIWFVQQFGRELRVINYYESDGNGLTHYIDYLHRFRDEHQIVYGHHYAPHDINVRELTTGKSRLETARKLGVNFIPVPNIPIQDGIQAARTIFPRCWFDRDRCKLGLRALKNYRREYDEKRGVLKNTPLHDWSSHGADGFRYFAVTHRDDAHSMSGPIKMRANHSGIRL